MARSSTLVWRGWVTIGHYKTITGADNAGRKLTKYGVAYWGTMSKGLYSIRVEKKNVDRAKRILKARGR